MHREKILRQLEQYLQSKWLELQFSLPPNTPTQATQTELLTTFVRRNSNCFDRQLLMGHITGSCWLLNNTGDKVLLTHHRKLGMWLQLGGHADGNPDVLAVAMQEAQEESGIDAILPLHNEIFDLDIHLIPEHKAVPEHLHYDIRYVLQVQDNSDFKVSDESMDLAWVDITKIANEPEFNPSLRRMAHKWLHNLG